MWNYGRTGEAGAGAGLERDIKRFNTPPDPLHSLWPCHWEGGWHCHLAVSDPSSGSEAAWQQWLLKAGQWWNLSRRQRWCGGGRERRRGFSRWDVGHYRGGTDLESPSIAMPLGYFEEGNFNEEDLITLGWHFGRPGGSIQYGREEWALLHSLVLFYSQFSHCLWSIYMLFHGRRILRLNYVKTVILSIVRQPIAILFFFLYEKSQP